MWSYFNFNFNKILLQISELRIDSGQLPKQSS